jgi:hypothetical protein
MEYFVARNLNHDGREYVVGSIVQLTTEAAQPLLDVGVLSSTAIEAAAPVQEPVVEDAQPEAADVATAGGTPTETGEPSLDTDLTESTDPDTREIGPHSETSPAPVKEAPAPVQEPEKPKRAATGRRSKPQEPTEPENDPSANL